MNGGNRTESIKLICNRKSCPVLQRANHIVGNGRTDFSPSLHVLFIYTVAILIATLRNLDGWGNNVHTV